MIRCARGAQRALWYQRQPTCQHSQTLLIFGTAGLRIQPGFPHIKPGSGPAANQHVLNDINCRDGSSVAMHPQCIFTMLLTAKCFGKKKQADSGHGAVGGGIYWIISGEVTLHQPFRPFRHVIGKHLNLALVPDTGDYRINRYSCHGLFIPLYLFKIYFLLCIAFNYVQRADATLCLCSAHFLSLSLKCNHDWFWWIFY